MKPAAFRKKYDYRIPARVLHLSSSSCRLCDHCTVDEMARRKCRHSILHKPMPVQIHGLCDAYHRRSRPL